MGQPILVVIIQLFIPLMTFVSLTTVSGFLKSKKTHNYYVKVVGMVNVKDDKKGYYCIL